jgi:hypothetical protein
VCSSDLVGFLIDAYLSMLWFSGEGIGDRPLLLLGTMLLITGVQFISLGLIGEMVARDSRDRNYTIEKKVCR